MYELWAKRRPVEEKGFPYEFIFDFYDESYKYSALDTLDKNIYQEAMVVKDNDCIVYVEFEKPYAYKLRRVNNE